MNRLGRGSRTPGVDPALRHAIRNQHRFGTGPTAASSAPALSAPGVQANAPIGNLEALAHTKSRLKGDKPTFNDWENRVVDHRRERLYIYGGVRPNDEYDTPTSDFYCLELQTMEWKNLTDSLRFRPKNYTPDPFSKNGAEFELRRLPALTDPGIALVSLGGGTFVFLFGGHNLQNTTSDLIAIDLDEYTWWFVDVPGTPILPRMSASLVAIENQLFIFGGRPNSDETSPAIRTYSIAVYNPDTRWTWMVSDAPMPPDLPLLGFNIQATPVYGGQKILLTQGRVQDNKPIDLSRESTIFFHTQNRTFQDARATMGQFPTGISWLRLGSVVPGPRPIPATIPALPTHNFTPSVVIFAWVNHPVHPENLLLEAWQYFLPPTERIRCLNLSEKLWDLDLDLQSFVAVGNRLLLLGSEEGKESIVQGDEMQVDKPLPRWDVAVEISSEYLSA
ncbi:hypothetical protein DFH09DRAFT_1038828 [Mycena vulgaris]|nr:hypothetical protein DFH09DRAFT_1038828 [Mycena vulgaris]